MPLYEYKCERCNEVFEVMQRFSDEPLTVHDHCGGAVRRLFSAPALQFKGSGWYVTDYARGRSAGSGGGNGKSKESAGGGGGPKDPPAAAGAKSSEAGGKDQ